MNELVLAKLNGLKPGEEKFIRLEQDYSREDLVSLDLASVLADSAVIKSFKAGEESLLKGVSIDPATGRIALRVSQGKVTKVNSAAAFAHFQELFTSVKA